MFSCVIGGVYGIWGDRLWQAEKSEERNDEKMRMDIERNTDSEKRLMGYITAIAESRDQ